MSTRCQVRVIQKGLKWEGSITLYKHMDGYPQGVIPIIKEAWEKYGGSWEAGRAGKVASFLCAIEPGRIKPEEGHSLRGDIEYYYIVHVINRSGGTLVEKPQWEVEVFVPVGALLLP